MQFERLTKFDVARWQAEVAIRLFARDDDPVAVHALSAAAYDVVRALLSHRAIQHVPLLACFLDQVRPECRNAAIAIMNGPRNFMKHADQDPEGTLDFSPWCSELILWDAAGAIVKLDATASPLCHGFWLWFLIRNRTFLRIPVGEVALVDRLTPMVTRLPKPQAIDSLVAALTPGPANDLPST